VEKVMLISTHAFTDRNTAHANVIDAAVKVGVRHLVFMPIIRKEHSSFKMKEITEEDLFTEEKLRPSGLTYTLAKHPPFLDVLATYIGKNAHETGVRVPAGKGKFTAATRDDLAAAHAAICAQVGAGDECRRVGGADQRFGKTHRPQAKDAEGILPRRLHRSLISLLKNANRGISMKIGFIGAGIVAQTISKHVLPFGHQVLLSNTRGPDSLASLVRELGPGATAGSPQEAAAQDMVVLAVNWSSVQTALFSIPDWKGRILVDATNRVASYRPLALGDISGRTSSEIVADLAPGARVVKAFNSVPMSWISDFSSTKSRTVLFISGDDEKAKKLLDELVEQVGLSCVDLGSLAIGGRLQQLGGPLAGIRLTFTERFAL
jgi:predicted dinucleotide-binding enzyme